MTAADDIAAEIAAWTLANRRAQAVYRNDQDGVRECQTCGVLTKRFVQHKCQMKEG